MITNDSTHLTTGICRFKNKLTDEQLNNFIDTLLLYNNFENNIDCNVICEYDFKDNNHEYEIKIYKKEK